MPFRPRSNVIACSNTIIGCNKVINVVVSVMFHSRSTLTPPLFAHHNFTRQVRRADPSRRSPKPEGRRRKLEERRRVRTGLFTRNPKTPTHLISARVQVALALFLGAPISRLAVCHRCRSNSSKVNTYIERAANPFRMRTSRCDENTRLKVQRNEHLQKSGRGTRLLLRCARRELNADPITGNP